MNTPTFSNRQSDANQAVANTTAEVERLRPLAESRVDGGRWIGPFLRAVREQVRAQHAAGLLS